MSACDALTQTAADSTLGAIRAVDCLANETAAVGFARLFGAQGSLLSGLTILLTLFIALFAIALLTGRTRIGVAVLTPQVFLLGAVLTFATSWIAYQSVIWNLAVAAPDELASTLLGTSGSAVEVFAGKLDQILAVIAAAADAVATPAAGAAQAAQGSFSPANLMWLAALLLMLGTVGVIVVSRIALGVLLAVGPVFIVLALFSGTRGLFAGWLRAVVLTGVTPLFAVLGGTMSFELLVPVLQKLQGELGIDGRAAISLFLVASVHCALMVLTLKVGATLVSGWHLGGSRHDRSPDPVPPAAAWAGAAAVPLLPSPAALRTIHPTAFAAEPALAGGPPPALLTGPQGRVIESHTISHAAASAPAPGRARGVGSRFRSMPKAQELLK
ncbi:MAG TPA: type IV secretion system protein [Novosphingobium sp.]|nr:type IV secretion system protein [Novosphingobium sp.]